MQKLNDYFDEVERRISYHFRNKSLLYQAFTRSSYSAENGGENNEVLEFIGDRVLEFYVTKIIAERFGFIKSQTDYFDENEDDDEYCIKEHRNEQDFTELKKEIVNNTTLAKKIDKLGFSKYLYLGKSDIDNNVWNQEKVKADLFEAILGAIAIDSDWNPDNLQNSVEFMLQIEDFLVDVEDGMDERPTKFMLENAINTLKELAEHGRCSIPEYYQIDEQIIRDGKIWWECTCVVRSWAIKKTAYATSKKEAKRYSAYLVLCDYYGLPDEFDDEDEDDE